MRDSADPVRRRWGRNTRHTLTYGYDEATVGSHAGISDTSQMLFIRPTGVRKDQIKPCGGPQDSGVSGDPAKATAEIGKMGIEFKVNAGINQYTLLKNQAPRETRRGEIMADR